MPETPQQRYRRTHLEQVREGNRKTMAKWRAAHPEQARARSVKWRAAHPERVRVSKAKYRQTPKGTLVAYRGELKKKRARLEAAMERAGVTEQQLREL